MIDVKGSKTDGQRFMTNANSIYLSKLGRLESIIQEKAAKCGSPQSAFADILSNVQQQMALYSGTSEAAVQPANGSSFAADAYTGYTGSTAAATGSEVDVAIEKAARSTGLDPDLIRAVIQTESSFRSNAVSGAGALGLMQLMPGTAGELGVTDPFDPYQNVMGGASYLAKQLQRFGDVRLALAAYNTGPGRIASYDITNANDLGQYERISAGVRGYVDKVLKYYGQYENR